jgi:DNA-binding NtrC family response regulator
MREPLALPARASRLTNPDIYEDVLRGIWSSDEVGVSTAQSAAEAERASSMQTIQFALLDPHSPGWSGIHMRTKLREQQPEIQVAIMTLR